MFSSVPPCPGHTESLILIVNLITLTLLSTSASIMAVVVKRRLELNCVICSHPLTSIQACLSEDAIQMVNEQHTTLRQKQIQPAANNYKDIEGHQIVATKCGHMFHLGCLRSHVKNFIERIGQAPCPICSKGLTLSRLWPVLIPPTPAQIARSKKLQSMKKQNVELKSELANIAAEIKILQTELVTIEKETDGCLEDIRIKQQQLDALKGPSEDEIESLRKIHQKRQSIVRVVTKHNADLLGVLMHETNVQISDADFCITEQELAAVCSTLEAKEKAIREVFRKGCSPRKRPKSKHSKSLDKNRNKIFEYFKADGSNQDGDCNSDTESGSRFNRPSSSSAESSEMRSFLSRHKSRERSRRSPYRAMTLRKKSTSRKKKRQDTHVSDNDNDEELRRQDEENGNESSRTPYPSCPRPKTRNNSAVGSRTKRSKRIVPQRTRGTPSSLDDAHSLKVVGRGKNPLIRGLSQGLALGPSQARQRLFVHTGGNMEQSGSRLRDSPVNGNSVLPGVQGKKLANVATSKNGYNRFLPRAKWNNT